MALEPMTKKRPLYYNPTSAEQIVDALKYHFDGKVGYVVFRITYGDDKRWEQFVQRLTEYMLSGLRGDASKEAAEAIRAVFELDIRDNEAELMDASKDAVREIFKAWVAITGGSFGIAKYGACIYADEEVVESVLSGEDPWAEIGGNSLRAYVKILDYQFEVYQYDSSEEPDEEMRELLNSGDEGCDPIDDCRSYDVGWVKAAARLLMPRTYAVLSNNGWQRMYERPPALSQY